MGDMSLEPCCAWLTGQGFRVSVGAHALDAVDYLAGQDRDRAGDLMEAFLDPEVDAVFCSRGGYGCSRLYPYLDFDQMAAAGKLFLGYSDITSLHLPLNQRGLPTVYSAMASSFLSERPSHVLEGLSSLLKGGSPIPAGAPAGVTVVPGVAEGEFAGGCLCLLTDSLGTPHAFDGQGKIVLIEDVDEPPHRVDAMLTHLLNAGALEGAKGFVIGEMTRSDEKTDLSIGFRPWRDIVRERLEPLGVPMIFEFPFGHVRGLLSLPLGLQVKLDAGTGTIAYLERLWS